MFSKKHAKKELKKLQHIKTWQLMVLLLLATFVSASFLRLNNIGMVERKEAVLSADKVGDVAVTKARLYDLQRYVTSHMNADMEKGVYLEDSFRRDTQAAYTAASNSNNPNGNIYKKAQEVCAPQFTSYSYAYLQCTMNELAKYPSAGNLTDTVVLPKASSYRHVFISPLWSPDFAGWSVLICIVIFTIIIIRSTSVAILKLYLHKRHSSF